MVKEHKQFYYIYKITSTIDDFYYIGRRKAKINHSSVLEFVSDGYWGSGGRKVEDWMNNVSPNQLNKEILSVQITYEDNCKEEEKEVGDLYRTDKNCLNSMKGGNFANNEVLLDYCEEHYLTKHVNDVCCKCLLRGTFDDSYCNRHGVCSFNKDKCVKCILEKRDKIGYCQKHKVTAFQGETCYTCKAELKNSMKSCVTHGKTIFQGSSCYKCFNSKSYRLDLCIKHGSTLFHGDLCCTCFSQDNVKMSHCKKHGAQKHRGNACYICIQEEHYEDIYCNFCSQITSHQGKACKTCVARNSIGIKKCTFHGEVKFKGNSCYNCIVEKTIHKRDHFNKEVVSQNCKYCPNISFKAICQNKKSTHFLEVTTHGDDLCLRCEHAKELIVKFCKTCNKNAKHQGKKCTNCLKVKSIKFCKKCDKSTTYLNNVCQSCLRKKSISVKNCLKCKKQTKHSGISCLSCRSYIMHRNKKYSNLLAFSESRLKYTRKVFTTLLNEELITHTSGLKSDAANYEITSHGLSELQKFEEKSLE